MQIYPEKLEAQLQSQLAGLYIISGEEPLLSIECCDQVRAAARKAGYAEREIFHAEQLDWDQVLMEARALSLFSDKRIFDIRTGDKLGADGTKALVELAESPPEDTLILVSCGKLDKKQLQTKWAKSVSAAGVIVQVWPVIPSQLPHWLSDRLAKAGIKANRQAVDILAERVEGNLLAARQEIEKLLLLLDTDEVDAQAMSGAVADSSRHDVFTLIDRVLAGEIEDASRSLRGLREEGNDVLGLLWLIARELRTLILVQEGIAAGQSMDTALAKAGVWSNRSALVRNAIRRLPISRLMLMLRLTRQIDMIAKGQAQGDAWLELENLLLIFSGHPVRSSATQRYALQ